MILFVSDLHLSEQAPKLTELFLQFLRGQARQASAVYILGDLFNLWIGDDVPSSFHGRIIEAIRTLTDQGIPIFLMHGNRDFLMGRRFAKACGCQLISDPTLVDVYGTKTLLMHGDTLCLNDTAYLRFRAIVQKKWIQNLFLMLPVRFRKRLGRQARKKSQQSQVNANELRFAVSDSEIRRLMKQYGAEQIIHGHTHHPMIRYFDLDSQPICHIVLSDWGPEGNVLQCDANGHNKLYYFIKK